MLKIYATPLSANGRKVLAVCRQLELNPEIHEVNVYRGEGRRPEYLAINPTGKIPALIDGEFAGKMRSMPTPKLTRRTVILAPVDFPRFLITTPSNGWMRSFSPSASFSLTWMRTVSPGRSAGKSFRTCAS